MGSPVAPNTAQNAALEQASELASLAPATVPVAAGRAALEFPLSRQAVSLLVLEY